MSKKILLICVLLVNIEVWALPTDKIHKYDQRYQIKNNYEKLVDNYGDNYEDLYGVRNFRAVLRGLVYRGGANNVYNKYKKRSNTNPLPTMGLENLCKQGFTSAVYLYANNFNTAPQQVKCKNDEGKNAELTYAQVTGFDEANTEKFLQMAYDMIIDKKTGPLFIHCWNGWHSSGVISALMLRQFCGLTAQEALNYWIQNTDEHDSGYDDLKKRIKEFKPLDKFKISKSIQQQICY